MIYAITPVILYLIITLWISVVSPWLAEQSADQAGWLRAQQQQREREDATRQEAEREELKRKQEVEKSRKDLKVGDFESFTFPIVRRTSPALIANSLISVQPMTSPVGGIMYYKPRYGAPEPYRTVLDELNDAVVAAGDDDPITIAMDIVREVFKDCPYSRYYQPPDMTQESAAQVEQEHGQPEEAKRPCVGAERSSQLQLSS